MRCFWRMSFASFAEMPTRRRDEFLFLRHKLMDLQAAISGFHKTDISVREDADQFAFSSVIGTPLILYVDMICLCLS